MRLLGQGAGRDTHRPSPAGWFSLPRNRATGRPDIRTTGRVMMEFRLSTRGRDTPTADQVWRLVSTSAVESTALVVFRLFQGTLALVFDNCTCRSLCPKRA